MSNPIESPDIETSSESYAGRFESPTGKWFLDVQAGHVLALLRQWPVKTVLDAGGGHGQLTEALIRAGYEVTILGSIEGCSNRIRPALARAQCRFTTGTLYDPPFPERAFDAVLGLHLLAHLNRPERLIAGLTRVAAYGVIVNFASSRSWNCLGASFFWLKRKVEGNTRHYKIFSPKAVEKLFAGCGWKRAGNRPVFFLPMALHRVIGHAGFSRKTEIICQKNGLTKRWGSPVIAGFVPASERRQVTV